MIKSFSRNCLNMLRLCKGVLQLPPLPSKKYHIEQAGYSGQVHSCLRTFRCFVSHETKTTIYLINALAFRVSPGLIFDNRMLNIFVVGLIRCLVVGTGVHLSLFGDPLTSINWLSTEVPPIFIDGKAQMRCPAKHRRNRNTEDDCIPDLNTPAGASRRRPFRLYRLYYRRFSLNYELLYAWSVGLIKFKNTSLSWTLTFAVFRSSR